MYKQCTQELVCISSIEQKVQKVIFKRSKFISPILHQNMKGFLLFQAAVVGMCQIWMTLKGTPKYPKQPCREGEQFSDSANMVLKVSTPIRRNAINYVQTKFMSNVYSTLHNQCLISINVYVALHLGYSAPFHVLDIC